VSALIIILLILAATPSFAVDIDKGILLDIPPEIQVQQFGKIAGSQLTPEDSADIAAFRFDGDTVKILVVLVRWSDRWSTYPSATFDSMILSHDTYPPGSVADYFEEVSYGHAHVTGTVLEWYNAGIYNAGYDFQDLLPILDASVDFSQYDGNNDGDVDAVIFVRAGTGQEDTGDPNDIWSYAYRYPTNSGPGPYDGVYVSAWNTSPELRPLRDPSNPTQFSGVDSLNQIRVFCHETTHNLGLPDMYDYDSKLDTTTYFTPNDDNDHPWVDWCLMGYAGYGILSIRSAVPPHINGWGKMQLGWIDPIELVGEYEDLVIYDINTHADSSLYLLPIHETQGEYFLLEYRNPRSTGKFDKVDSDFSCYFWPDLTYGCDTLDRGLLISHVHDSLGAYWWRINNGMPSYPHYTVTVVDAGYNPSMDLYQNPEGRLTDSAQWWYPYETRRAATYNPDVPGQTEFSPTTTPSSEGYFGPTNITVRVDSIVDDKMYAYVFNPYGDIDFDGVLDDGDGSGVAWDNPCTGGQTVGCDDNCPYEPNPDQADTNHNLIGDVCDYRFERWDTVATACVSLTVSNLANYGHQSNTSSGGANMAHPNEDCDQTANVWLYDGSSVICYVNGTDTVGNWSLFQQFHYCFVDDRRWMLPTATSTDYDEFFGGTHVTADSTLAVEDTWYAPKSLTDCNFVIHRTTIFTYDAAVHSGLTIGEVTDWDVPDNYGWNVSGITPGMMLYQTGTDLDCIDQSRRLASTDLIGWFLNDSCDLYDNSEPYGAYCAANSDYVWATGDFVASDLMTAMQQTGYTAHASAEDQHMVLTYLNDFTIGATDSLVIFSVLITLYDADPADLDNTRTLAVQWVKDYLVESCSCCQIVGDVDHNGSGPDIADLVYLVTYMFQNGPEPPCMWEANMNGSVNPEPDITDLVYLVTYMFQNGPDLYPCAGK